MSHHTTLRTPEKSETMAGRRRKECWAGKGPKFYRIIITAETHGVTGSKHHYAWPELRCT